MAEGASSNNLLQILGGISLFLGFMVMSFSTGLGITCCLFGFFGLAAGAISSSMGSLTGEEGKMVLKQDPNGQWNWVSNSPEANQQIAQSGTVDIAAQYNDQSTQVLSRVISEVRNGTNLEDLEPNELETLASAYGINGGSEQQKIDALKNSKLSSKALKLSAVAVAGGVGAIGTAKIVKSGRERAAERAEELRAQAKTKLQDNISKGAQRVDSRLPTNESGETATQVAHNAILEQMSAQIRERNLTPEIFIEIADFNNDQKLDPIEISGALTAAMGFAVPVFVISSIIKEFDENGDGELDQSELHKLWAHLGFDLEAEEFDDDEIDSVLEEIELEDEIIEAEVEVAEVVETEVETEEVVEAEVETEEVGIDDALPENNVNNIELTDGIDTEFEELIVEIEDAKLSSERRLMLAKQVNQYLITIRITKMERTLLGSPVYRGGQSIHGLLDGGPYTGIVKIPVSLDEEVLQLRAGDELKIMAKITDFSASLKRPVLEADQLL